LLLILTQVSGAFLLLMLHSRRFSEKEKGCSVAIHLP
jgi:hypothetical protein